MRSARAPDTIVAQVAANENCKIHCRYKFFSYPLKSAEANIAPLMPMNPPGETPKAKPKPDIQKAMPPMLASKRFLIRIFFEFLLRTKPFSIIAKPSWICMRNAVVTRINNSLIAYSVELIVWSPVPVPAM